MAHENTQYNQIQAWIFVLIMQIPSCSIHVLIINRDKCTAYEPLKH